MNKYRLHIYNKYTFELKCIPFDFEYELLAAKKMAKIAVFAFKNVYKPVIISLSNTNY